jgi:hypothetical protein
MQSGIMETVAASGMSDSHYMFTCVCQSKKTSFLCSVGHIILQYVINVAALK